MAAETTVSTIAGRINNSYLSDVMLDYAIDAAVIGQFMRVENLAGKGTNIARFGKTVKDTAGAITEGTAMSNTALDATATSVTAAEVGILRNPTKLAMRSAAMSEDEFVAWVVEDGTKLCIEKFETDLAARFASASNSVGVTTTAFTLAQFAAGVSRLGISKAKGRAVFIGSGKQAADIRDALMSTTATVFASGQANNILQKTGDDGYVGNLMGTDFWQTNLCPLANADADRVGCFLIDAAAKPENAAIGVALLWMPELEQVNDPALTGRKMSVSMAYGEGEVEDFNYVKAVSRKE